MWSCSSSKIRSSSNQILYFVFPDRRQWIAIAVLSGIMVVVIILFIVTWRDLNLLPQLQSVCGLWIVCSHWCRSHRYTAAIANVLQYDTVAPCDGWRYEWVLIWLKCSQIINPHFFFYLRMVKFFFLILKYIFLNLDLICMQEGSVQ